MTSTQGVDMKACSARNVPNHHINGCPECKPVAMDKITEAHKDRIDRSFEDEQCPDCFNWECVDFECAKPEPTRPTFGERLAEDAANAALDAPYFENGVLAVNKPTITTTVWDGGSDDEVVELLMQARALLNKAWLASWNQADYAWEQELTQNINTSYDGLTALIEQRIYGRKAL